mgnify:CR=1 FL=1
MGTHILWKGAYLALCSRLIETSQLSDTVMDLATVGVYGCDYITANGVLYTYNKIGKILHVVAYIISAWALTLSVQQYRAMRRPLSVGQTTGSSHAFLCSYETFMSNRTVLMGTYLRT